MPLGWKRFLNTFNISFLIGKKTPINLFVSSKICYLKPVILNKVRPCSAKWCSKNSGNQGEMYFKNKHVFLKTHCWKSVDQNLALIYSSIALWSVHTVMRNYGMNQNFADVNPERDFQPFDDEKNSHLQTKISWSKTTWNQ